jgi:hypothetical protein
MKEKELIDYIKDNRKIRDISLKTYIGNVRKLNNNKPIDDLKFLKKTSSIIEKIKDFKLPTQRNYLTSILVILTKQKNYIKECEKYKTRLKILNDQYNEHINSHLKTEKEDKNWSTLSELKKNVFNYYKRDISERALNNKTTLTSKEFDLYQRFVVVSLYLLIPSVRLDYSNMVVVKSRSDMENKKRNYLLNLSRNKKYFYINEYKTSDKHGEIEIKIPPPLNTILNQWLKFNDNQYLLLNKANQPMSDNVLSKYITKAFAPSNKNITLNLLRKFWISENVDLEALKRRKALANSMQHSLDVQEQYIKIN